MKIARSICCAISACVLLSLTACTDKAVEREMIRPVKTAMVIAPDNLMSASFPGRAEPVREVNLAFEVTGTLDKFPVKVGDQLKKGDLLAHLNQKNFAARLRATEARYRKAVNDEQRLRKLLKSGSASQTLYDDAQTNLDVLESQLALDKKALADTTLRAPFDGQVVAVYLDNYTFVPASTQVARLIDISQIEMWVDLPEQFAVMSEQSTDYAVKVIFDAYPEKMVDATIKEWGLEASRESRTFPVGLVMDQPEEFTILPGMSGVAFAETRLEDFGLAEAVEVPAGAIFTPLNQQSSSVWVVENNKTLLRPVVVHSINRDTVVVSSGLKHGEQVVVAGVHSIENGQTVRVLNAKPKQKVTPDADNTSSKDETKNDNVEAEAPAEGVAE